MVWLSIWLGSNSYYINLMATSFTTLIEVWTNATYRQPNTTHYHGSDERSDFFQFRKRNGEQTERSQLFGKERIRHIYNILPPYSKKVVLEGVIIEDWTNSCSSRGSLNLQVTTTVRTRNEGILASAVLRNQGVSHIQLRADLSVTVRIFTSMLSFTEHWLVY